MNTIVEQLETPVRTATEVLIVGGGIAGISAAIAARRAGAKVLLIEKSALLGGLATNGLINWFEPLCNGQGEQLIFGLAEELLRLSIRYGDDTLPQIWRNRSLPFNPSLVRPEKHNMIGGRYGTFFSPTLFQLALDELVQDEGVELRLEMSAVLPVMKKGRCTGVIVESSNGRECYPANVVIDATGDAAMLARAGLPCVIGKNYLSLVAHMSNLERKESAIGLRRWISLGADLHGNGQPVGYPLAEGVTNEDVTGFLLEGRRMLRENLLGKERSQLDIVALPSIPQLRTIRRLTGSYTLTKADCKKTRLHSIGLAADFERVGDWYEIPWGCLHNSGCGNILAAGRIVSAEGWAWDVTRVIPVCALTGQAAGIAAALMNEATHSSETLPIGALQQELERQEVRLHY